MRNHVNCSKYKTSNKISKNNKSTVNEIKRRRNMTINMIFKIAAVGILVSVLGQVLKHSGRDEQAFLVSLAGLILVLLWVVPYIEDLFETIQRLFTIG